MDRHLCLGHIHPCSCTWAVVTSTISESIPSLTGSHPGWAFRESLTWYWWSVWFHGTAFLPDFLGLQSRPGQLLRAACLLLQRQNLRSYKGTCQLLLLAMLTQENQHISLYDDLAGQVLLMTLEGLLQPLLNNFVIWLMHRSLIVITLHFPINTASFSTEFSFPSPKHSCFCPVLPGSSLGL